VLNKLIKSNKQTNIMTNQEITSAVKAIVKLKFRTFNQEQLAQLFNDGKHFNISLNDYELSESRTYVDENVKMLITKGKVYNEKVKYSWFITSWL
jgi:hypothetical protein